MQKVFDRYWLLLMVGVLLGILLFTHGRDYILTETKPRQISERGELASFEITANKVFTSASASVVYIFTEQRGHPLFGNKRTKKGSGSGFIWDTAGHVITNHHVIYGADRVFVRFDSGNTAQANIVGSSPDHDLAVLKITGLSFGLVPIPLGRSNNLKIGQAVFAIGNPFGLTRSLSTGVVSALGRRLPTSQGREIPDAIQTDAAINPGNSGGPLLDSAGRLIGVNTAIISKSGTYSGIGFAVPVDTVNKIAPQIITRGKPEKPGIGIRAGSQEIAARLNIKGIVILDVAPGGPAERAGLIGVSRTAQRLGDIIIAVDNEPVSTIAQLTNVFEKIGVGKKVRLTVMRDDSTRYLYLKLVDIG
ncbi:MAG: trypsin-like peptidase domain-containing protein [Hyphomicrobiaceae bacterium]|nr:trypsin-like peptidase domain-containing protein [Hyphomicrobiaceae bacterium]